MTEKSASVPWTGAGKKGLGKISTESEALNRLQCLDRPRAKGSVMPQKVWSAKRERQYAHIKPY